jgi:hypothetical protein
MRRTDATAAWAIALGMVACGGAFSDSAGDGGSGSGGTTHGGGGGTGGGQSGGSAGDDPGSGGSSSGTGGSTGAADASDEVLVVPEMDAEASGGAAGAGGQSGVGGQGGTAGQAGSGGASQGSGGTGVVDANAPETCTTGALECDAHPQRRCGDDQHWHDTVCGPLRIADLTGIDVAGLTGFDVGFRCKSLSVCGVSQNCIYFSETLGSRQSSESTYTDGASFPDGVAVKVNLDVGAASQCQNPSVTIPAGASIIVAFGTRKVRIYFPAFMGTSLLLFVREDGATFKDAGLTQLLQKAP